MRITPSLAMLKLQMTECGDRSMAAFLIHISRGGMDDKVRYARVIIKQPLSYKGWGFSFFFPEARSNIICSHLDSTKVILSFRRRSHDQDSTYR